MDTGSVFPPPQRLTPAEQERLRGVLFGAIRPTTAERPRAGARRWPAIAAGAAAATAGALAWVVIGSGGLAPEPAWAAVPRSVPAALASQLAKSCQTQVAQHSWPIRSGQVGTALAEQRGASTAVLLLAAGHDAICVDPHPAAAGTAGGIIGPLVGVSVEDPAGGVLTVDGTPGGPGLGLRAVYGRVGSPRVAKVLITLSDGREVTATLGHGHYLAWWPATAGGDIVRAVDSAGHTVASARLALTGANPIPQHSR